MLARLDAVFEAATTVDLEALNDSEKPTARLYLQKGSPGSRQQRVHGHSGPTVMNPTVSEIEQSGSASQDDDDDSDLAFVPHCVTRIQDAGTVGYELATLTRTAWVNIFRRRFSLRQQQRPQSNSLSRLQPAVPTESLAVIANQVAAAPFSGFPILSYFHSQPGQRCNLVRFCALLVAAQLVRLAVKLDFFLSARVSLAASRVSQLCCSHVLFSFMRSVSHGCSGHLARFAHFTVVSFG